jgi:hypothetical protein
MKRAIPVGTALDRVLAGIGNGELVWLARIEAAWPTIVGEALVKNSRPAYLDGSRLTIWVTEPAWAEAMRFEQQKILARIGSAIGVGRVTTLTFQRQAFDVVESTGPTETPAPPPSPKPTDEELATIETAVATVDDPSLRELCKQVMLKSLIVNKTRDAE